MGDSTETGARSPSQPMVATPGGRSEGTAPRFPQASRLPLWFLVIVTLATLVFFDRPLIRGDGVAYLAWVDSLALDFDLDLANQYGKFSAINEYAVVWNWHNGKYVNAFPFGVAVLQFPFYQLGHFFVEHNWLNLNRDYFLAMQGVEFQYSLWIMVGANLMALGAVVLAWRAVRAHCNPWFASFAVWGVFVGSPLLYYSTVSPLYSHNAGAFLVACFLYLAFRATDFLVDAGTKPARDVSAFVWIGMGISAGLMTLCRWQLFLVAVPVWGVLLWQRRWKGILLATVPAVLVALPLPLVWKNLFGSPFVVPYDVISGQPFLRFPVNSVKVLAATFYHSPIFLLCIPGLFKAWKHSRAWTVAIVMIFVLQVLINGSAFDLGGESYGMRRMSELFFLFGLLSALGLGFMPAVKPRLQWCAAALLRVLLIVLAAYSFLYLLSYLDFQWTSQVYAALPSPKQVLSYFVHQPDRWRVTAAVLRAHVGPLAWPMPGP